MNRGWFREKLADKLLFGILASVVTALVLAVYQDDSQRIAFAQKNVDTFITQARASFSRVTDAVDGSITQIALFTSGAERSKITLARKIVATRATLSVTKPAFEARTGAASPIGAAIDECIVAFAATELDADQVTKLSSSQFEEQTSSLTVCRNKLVPAFDQLLSDETDRSFDTAIAKRSVEFLGLRLTWSIVALIAVLAASLVVMTVWYLRLPEDEQTPSPSVANPMG